MKPFEPTNADALKTINECRRAGREHSPGHSKGKPAVSSMTTNIDVRFATPLPLEIEIRRRTRPPELKPGPLPVRRLPEAWITAINSPGTGNQ